MECRVGCAACCIAPTISSPIPGAEGEKAAGIRCFQLTADNRCKLFGHADRPLVCRSLKASVEMCGYSNVEAMQILTRLEQLTRPETIFSERSGSAP